MSIEKGSVVRLAGLSDCLAACFVAVGRRWPSRLARNRTFRPSDGDEQDDDGEGIGDSPHGGWATSLFANWDDNERDDDPGHEHDNNDDETLSERCGTDVQLLWSPAKQRKAQLFICTMSQKCQAAKGAKDSLAIASGSGSAASTPPFSSLKTKAIMTLRSVHEHYTSIYPYIYISIYIHSIILFISGIRRIGSKMDNPVTWWVCGAFK